MCRFLLQSGRWWIWYVFVLTFDRLTILPAYDPRPIVSADLFCLLLSVCWGVCRLGSSRDAPEQTNCHMEGVHCF